MMRLLTDTPDSELRGVRVLLRAGLDVPLTEGAVANDFRIERAVPSIAYLRERGARVIIIAHLGRDEAASLAPVAAALSEQVPVSFVPHTVGKGAEAAVAQMKDGDVIMLENLRRDGREQENDPAFADALARLGDYFVNDAFSVCHRPHASIIGVPALLPNAAGIGLAQEVAHLEQALVPPEHSLCILGGAKFETKEPLIRKLLEVYERVFVCGALANDIFRARGLPVGTSRVSEGVPSEAVLSHPRLLVPVDVMVRRPDGTALSMMPEEVGEQDAIKDMGPNTLAMLAPYITASGLTLWNGPTGLYEEGFTEWSAALAHAIAASSALSIVGGGDTVASLEKADALHGFSFVSTGGGAMLEFLLDGTLPGLTALS